MPENTDRNLKSNFLWNTAGVVFSLVCQWLITVLVVRFSDDYVASGILSLAMSLANVFAMIALFNMRNYQVSDTENRFSQSEYLAFRLITVTFSLALLVVCALVLGYEPYVFFCIVGFMIVKLAESFADVLHGTAQRKWRLDVAGKSFIIRGALMLVSFVAVFPLTDNLALAIAVMAITNVLAVLLYDLPATLKIERLSIHAQTWRRSLPLFKVSLPMVIYGLAINSMMPVAKCILEAVRGEEALGVYGSVTTVATLIQTFVILIFTPLIGIFGEAHSRGDRRSLAYGVLKLVAMIGALTGVALLLVLFLGEPVMVLVFGEGISDFVYLLYPTVIISALTALVWMLGMVLVVMRGMASLLFGSILGFAVSTVLCAVLSRTTLYSGVNIGLAVGLCVTGVLYLCRFIYYVITGK